ncbi:MAG TPA: SGNH/GDSL hydrolase family protein [Opitutales bacterium]|nr:SGNH/GDSL hydrolase family protein [Opitutales bacterium]
MSRFLCASHLLQLAAFFAIIALAGCVHSGLRAPANSPVTVGADNPMLRFSGRSEGIGTSRVTLGYSGARVRLRFVGTSVGVRMTDDSGENIILPWIDGKAGTKIRLNSPDGLYTLATDLEPGEHTVEVVRITEGSFGLMHFKGFELNAGATVLPWRDAHSRKIEFIGDSITCGYGVEADDPNLHFEAATENFCLGYPGLAARALDADYLVVSRSGIGILRNFDGPYDGSADTMPEVYPHTFYLQRNPDWDFARFVPDVVCINLGTNDFSTTGVNVGKFESAYVSFAKTVLAHYPKAKLVIVQGPMNNSVELRDSLARIVSRLDEFAKGRVSYCELSAQGAAGYGADYHPNRAQAQISAAEFTQYLADLMDWR